MTKKLQRMFVQSVLKNILFSVSVFLFCISLSSAHAKKPATTSVHHKHAVATKHVTKNSNTQKVAINKKIQKSHKLETHTSKKSHHHLVKTKHKSKKMAKHVNTSDDDDIVIDRSSNVSRRADEKPGSQVIQSDSLSEAVPANIANISNDSRNATQDNVISAAIPEHIIQTAHISSNTNTSTVANGVRVGNDEKTTSPSFFASLANLVGSGKTDGAESADGASSVVNTATAKSEHSSNPFRRVNIFPRVDVAKFVRATVDHLRYSMYKLGGSHFDTSRGVYIVDCSNFVDQILRKVSPHAYSSLVNATGAESPASQHYYNFFKDLSSDQNEYWNKVENVQNLLPGDILVFRYKNSRGNQTGGHVMVVMDKPIGDNDSYSVRVADSAPSRHSNDTRQYNESGIGIGTLLLKANHITGRPQAYAWAENSYWHNNVNFAMARPLSVD